MAEVQEAARTCPFHHSSQPSLPLGDVQNQTPNGTEVEAECDDEFMMWVNVAWVMLVVRLWVI